MSALTDLQATLSDFLSNKPALHCGVRPGPAALTRTVSSLRDVIIGSLTLDFGPEVDAHSLAKIIEACMSLTGRAAFSVCYFSPKA